MEVVGYKIPIILLLSLFCSSLYAAPWYRGFYVRLDGAYYYSHINNIAERFSQRSVNDRISEEWEKVASKNSNKSKNYTFLSTIGYRFNQFFGIEIGIEKSPTAKQKSEVVAIDYQDISSVNYYTFKNSATIKQMIVKILPVFHLFIHNTGLTLLAKAGVDIVKQELDINSRGDYYSSFAEPPIHEVRWTTSLNKNSIFLTPEVGLGLSYQFSNSKHWSLLLQWLHVFSVNKYYTLDDPTRADTILQPNIHSIMIKKFSGVNLYTLGIQYVF